MDNNTKPLDLDNIEVAFKGKTDGELKKAYWLFKAIAFPSLVKASPALLRIAMAVRFPVVPIVRATIFKHFCGGENIHDCNETVKKLWQQRIGSILDYSVEGEENEGNFDKTTEEICATVERAQGDPSIPFCVFKVTGISRFALLEKVSSGATLSTDENDEYSKVRERIGKICGLAAKNRVRLFIDAEESWIQPAIDGLADDMMALHNKEHVIVYNTIQLYRTDRLTFLKKSHERGQTMGYKNGFKLVRGAYMEKERARAVEMGYPSPIQPDREHCNRDYDDALRFCIEHIDSIAICAGTHNENSSRLLTTLMREHQIPNDHPSIWFSQLLGMSDHLSGNLANSGYMVAKYVPYGPVKSVLPYLIRRAQENTSIAGQTGRELSMIMRELKRRRNIKG
ncbi:MAG: proline dehydrogenase family protein [Bacteroidota bacterium]